MDSDLNIPGNWKKISLGEIVVSKKGKKPKIQEENEFEGSVPYLDIKAFEKKEIRRYADKSSSIEIDENDIAIVWDGSRSGWVGKGMKGALGSTLVKIKSFIINKDYLYHFLSFQYSYINNNTKGTGIPHVNPEILWNIKIALPPLEEQNRIILGVDELFSDLDNSTCKLRVVQKQLKLYKEALFKSAFEGRLTKKWRKENNLHDAKKIITKINLERKVINSKRFENWRELSKNNKIRKPKNLSGEIGLLDSVLEPFNKLPNGWIYHKLEAVIEEPRYGTSKKCSYEIEGSGVLRIPNLKFGYIDEKDLKFAEFSKQEKLTFQLRNNDILMIRSNGSIGLVGKCSLVKENNTDKLYAGYLIRLRPISKIINAKYIIYCLSSFTLRQQIELKAKSTSGVNNINSGEINSLIIPICSLEEQEMIVTKLDYHFSVIEKLQQMIDSSLLKSEVIRLSILKKAFEGKLVEQELNDKSILKLLLDIKFEKEKYINKEKERKKLKPKKINKMSKNLSIEEVLKNSKEPMLAKDVWQQSKHKKDIEEFYTELKRIQESIKEIKKGTESLLSIKL